MCFLISTIFLATILPISVSLAQTLPLGRASAVRVFGLAEEFSQQVKLRPGHGSTVFPWRIIGEGGNLLGVVEGITVDGSGANGYYVLDARLADGNDLKIAVPVAIADYWSSGHLQLSKEKAVGLKGAREAEWSCVQSCRSRQQRQSYRSVREHVGVPRHQRVGSLAQRD